MKIKIQKQSEDVVIAKTEQLSKLMDEMIKLLIIKTRKSIHPPYITRRPKSLSLWKMARKSKF